jgi:hypothetical protein
MESSRKLASFCAFAAVALLLIGGCAAKKTSEVGQQRPRPVEEPQLAASEVAGRVHDLQSRINALEADANQLPGQGANGQAAATSHRQLMQRCFADLEAVLPLIAGQNPSSEFRQGMRVLETSRQQLASGSTELAAEPTIGQGLRAATRLLSTLNAFAFENDANIAKHLDALQQRLNQLDTTHGATSRVVASQAMRDTADVLQQMTNALAERAGLETGGRPTTNPATKPDTTGAARAH